MEGAVTRPGLGPAGSRSGQDTLGPSIQRSQPLLHTSIALDGRRLFAAPRPEVAFAYVAIMGLHVPSSFELRPNW